MTKEHERRLEILEEFAGAQGMSRQRLAYEERPVLIAYEKLDRAADSLRDLTKQARILRARADYISSELERKLARRRAPRRRVVSHPDRRGSKFGADKCQQCGSGCPPGYWHLCPLPVFVVAEFARPLSAEEAAALLATAS